MLRPRQKAVLAPQQELVQGRLWVAVNDKVVFVGPDLQAHQDHPNVESPIQLQAEEEAVRREGGGGGVENVRQFYLVDVIYGAQNASLGLAPVSFVLGGKPQTSASASDWSWGGARAGHLPQCCPQPQTAPRTSARLRRVWVSDGQQTLFSFQFTRSANMNFPLVFLTLPNEVLVY